MYAATYGKEVSKLTFTAGVTMKTSDIDFKFFHINKWDNGEFKGDAISTTSDLVEITESGNLKLQEGQKFERGGVYKFTVDVTKGNTKAVLTVEKVGQVDLPRPDITINGMKPGRRQFRYVSIADVFDAEPDTRNRWHRRSK